MNVVLMGIFGGICVTAGYFAGCTKAWLMERRAKRLMCNIQTMLVELEDMHEQIRKDILELQEAEAEG